MKRLLPALAVLVPAIGVAQTNQCTDGTTVLAHRYVKRTTINNVQSQAGTWVVGTYAANWDTNVQQTAYYEGSQSHYGTQSIQNGPSTVTFNDTPSTNGTGTYSNSNGHQAYCDQWPYTISIGTSSDTQEVDAPTIGNLPYINALWYFGPGTPGAVPAHVGYQSGRYAFQYANLTYNKNCLSNDVCNGTPTWGEIDAEGAISVTSSGVLTSTDGHADCSYDSAVQATLNGWTITEAILVNWPTSVSLPIGQSVTTTTWGASGYKTDHPWNVNDNCGNFIPSMALNETLGTFSNPGVTSGWPDPPEGDSTWFPSNEYYWIDSIGADSSTWVPDPVFTVSSPPYTYNTKLKYTNDQKWFIGTDTNGSGHQIFDGTMEFYQDHGYTLK